MKTTEEIREICEEIKIRTEKKIVCEERADVIKKINDGIPASVTAIMLSSLRCRERMLDIQIAYFNARNKLNDYRARLERL